MKLRCERLGDGPILSPDTPGATAAMGTNINGPSLLRVPDWLPNPLGRYYLYFGHHGGKYIRLAYAEVVTGPWTVYEPGTLQLEQTPFGAHIASPDVHLDHERREVVMYFHGCCMPDFRWNQPSCRATSSDGLHFSSADELITASYLRVFRWGDWFYGIAHAGALFRSRDGISGWEERRSALDRSGRHWAVYVRDGFAHWFYTRWGDRPERILWAPMLLTEEWSDWALTERQSILRPERAWEGADEPLRVSLDGSAKGPSNELRDPYLFEDEGRLYLVYAVAGESGLALAEVWIEG